MIATEAIRLEREKRKTARLARKAAREDKLFEILTSPTMVRLALVSGIIAYSTYCARSPYNVGPVQSSLAFALPGIGLPLIAADAGVTDWRALAAISAAGVSYTAGQMTQGWGAEQFYQALTPWKD